MKEQQLNGNRNHGQPETATETTVETLKYSVIIPIYNSEKTIRRCLDSLIRQNEPEAELLLIDDGSSDESGAICREYANQYPNVRCFCQENRGVSAARNLGLRNAVGTYVLFVDSDDYVEPTYFSAIGAALEADAPELLLFSHRTIGRKTYLVSLEDGKIEGQNAVSHFISTALRRQEFNALWSKVFLRSVIERFQLAFDESLCIDEDVNFTFSYVMHIERIRVISDALYCFCVENPNSLSRKKRDYLSDQLLAASISREKMTEEAHLTADCGQIIRDALAWVHFRGVYSSASELLKYDYSAKTRRKTLAEICEAFAQTDLKPRSLRCRLLSFPVQRCMTGLIDLSAKLAAVERKHRLNY